ncbi:MAG: ribosome biogenesis GTPase Der [Planctomycetes bacterium]|nr:ribosome biogenesis GTPase Der [Planctomycetota bacterium]
MQRVTIVGRPNVGKSSLLNRIAGRRISIVEPTAGVTRDRVAVTVEWQGRTLEVIDTGGLGLVDDHLLKEHVEAQIRVALAGSDAVLFVVDAKEGLVPMDETVAQELRRLSDRVHLVVNKVESRWEEYSVSDWFKLGFGEPIPVSANEGFGISDLLDHVVAHLPALADAEPELESDDVLRVAIVGKRNSGKSTLVNLLAGSQRVIVSDVPGTTRDAVDVEVAHGDQRLLLIDTAGMRKNSSIADAIEFYSQARAFEAIRRAHTVLHLFDVTEPISQVDKKIADFCVKHGKSVLIVGNKLDLAEELTADQWDDYIKQQLSGLWYCPVSFISALDGENVAPTLDVLFELRQQARTQIPTSRLNEVLQEARDQLRPKSRSLVPKLFYGTQIGTEPVSIVVFVNEPKLFRGVYERFLQRALQEAFGIGEVPIRLVFRRRDKVKLDP